MDIDIDSEWDNFLENNNFNNNNYYNNNLNDYKIECSELYISTKTKIIYINELIDIYDIFWKIPILKYNKQECGIIKNK